MAQDYTNASNGDYLDVARSIIDRDIARLEDSENIRALKSRRNELSPIYRLPPEILCHIFSFIEDRSNSQPRRPESWINFSRISQHRRSLALSAPELWTNIPVIYPRWADEMLRRSKMAKLTLQVDSLYHLHSIKRCLSHMTRLEEINISDSRFGLEKLFQDLSKSAPQLHTFHIENPSATIYPSISPFTIDDEFLSHTERLRCVHLVGCKINWDSRLLISLTRLTLHNSLKDSNANSLIQFLHALQRMPALTNLDLENSIPYDPGGPSSYPLVDLPCLRVLRIWSEVDTLTTTLGHLTFPSSATLNLICQETRSDQLNFSNFLSVLDVKFLSSFVIQSLSLQGLGCITTMQGGPGLKFSLGSTTSVGDISRYHRFPPSPLLDLVLTWPTSNLQTYAKALTDAFNIMNLRTLTQLQLSLPTSFDIDSNTWLKTFGKLPLLERVHVNHYTAHSFLEALGHKTKETGRSLTAYRCVSFPKLRGIWIDGTRFESISVENLMDIIMERYERNAEIQALRLEDCYNISKNDVERLREIVVDVVWTDAIFW